MKKASLIILGIVFASVAIAQTFVSNERPTNALRAAAFTWMQTSFDFGKIKVGVPVTHEFKFTNTGDAPLVITSVQASCGCTVAEYTKEPIPAGAQGFVKATYNAAKAGVFTKTVTINANTEESAVLLSIKGEVTE
ncbi:DUF1573 domain-containing protein [Ohtaekwangia koreensis]|uniref:DUF1573 domain-containing protein n=1 Tax=Ohtaekwangia koreensis TaxID=688867 RepID=A0A1T5LCQ0_9BACT|nr:DUF1573 domain-containing protein [Ohtaekwangia koreensis]SKC73797.1 Protein of unknown function [Ohtaekwangia koreensis]